jgi:hypothetical protein
MRYAKAKRRVKEKGDEKEGRLEEDEEDEEG